jgi:acyl-coenzyme A thioesterase PaaI-like protein
VKLTANNLRRGMNLWPPLLCSGIRITQISDDYRAVDVELRQRFYNKNYVGSHFGGSLFAMTDPFWMMMVMNNLDRSYTVWDREGTITFLKPASGTVTARFRLDQECIDDIRANTANEKDKYLPVFEVDIVNAKGIIVARVTKTLHIRRKPDTRGRIGS